MKYTYYNSEIELCRLRASLRVLQRDLIDIAGEDYSFLKKILTGDETLGFLNNPQTSEWKGKTSLGRKPRENVTKQLKDLPGYEIEECFEQLYERWNNFVDVRVQYFEV
ncbi:hypothetical protein TNCV_3177721 [Trichonephila clavipes]|nr:hypothetical protein TNCV_3177721 [Trichonephila clavipes]